MVCSCWFSCLGFSSWESLTDAVNVITGERGFGNVTSEPGVYCIRVASIGEADIDKIINNYRKSLLYEAYRQLSK